MTLLEVMVVLGILAALLAIGIPRLGRNPNNLKKVVREMSVLGKEIRMKARLKNRTFRLVIEMPTKGEHRYWVESADGPVAAKSDQKIKEESSLDKKERPKDPFQKDDSIIKKERTLPNGYFFGQVESALHEGVTTEGTAYIYFMPQGLVENAAIQITDKKNITWTLMFNPLTGRCDIFEEAVALKDATH